MLFSFNGIYGSITEGGFSKQFLLANSIAYLWGMAISLGVNLIVWPFTAEAELRQLLVTSLQHVSTLAHLTCKTYARELDQDEVDVRQVLVKALRSDYLALNERLDETSFEVTISRWSLKHYRDMIKAVQGLQQALITSSSAIDLISAIDPRGINSRHLLARSEAAKTFADFRHGIDLVIAEIIDELVGPVAVDVEPDAELAQTNETMAERQTSGRSQAPATVDPDEQLGHALHTSPTPTAAQEKMMTVAARLKKEVRESERRHRKIREESIRSASASRRGDGTNSNASSRPGTPGHSNLPSPRHSTTDLPRGRGDQRPLGDTAVPGEALRPSDIPATTTDPEKAEATHTDVVQIFRKAWDAFARAQQDALVSLIKDGSIQVDDSLRIEEGMPSIKEMCVVHSPRTVRVLFAHLPCPEQVRSPSTKSVDVLLDLANAPRSPSIS